VRTNHTTCKAKTTRRRLTSIDAGEADLLEALDGARLLGGIGGALVVLQLDQAQRQAGIVVDGNKQNSRCASFHELYCSNSYLQTSGETE
jgi:hypothetical protein